MALIGQQAGGVSREHVAELVRRMPGVALGLDQDRRVVALSLEAEAALQVPASRILGRRCHEVIAGVQPDGARPCYEGCARGEEALCRGWADASLVRGKWPNNGPMELECFTMKCDAAGSGSFRLWFVGPPGLSRSDSHARVLEAFGTLGPVLSRDSDFAEVLEKALSSVLRATFAEGVEITVLDPDTGEATASRSLGISPDVMAALREAAKPASSGGDGLWAGEATLSAGPWPESSYPGQWGWYLSVPLLADKGVLGRIALASRRPNFDVAAAARVLLPLSSHLSVYLRWALPAPGRRSLDTSMEASTADAQVRVRCLGSFQVEAAGEPVPDHRFKRSKALTLLKYLVAHRGQPTSREAIIEALWPGADPSKAGVNLRVVLHALRRALEPGLKKGAATSLISSRGDFLCLDATPRVWVDAEEFAASVRLGAAHAREARPADALREYRRGAGLYQGDYMADEPYSDWCLFERERMREMYLDMHKDMAMILAQRGNLTSAIEVCQNALQVDRGREELHRFLIQYLRAAGRRDEALRQFEVCRRTLQEEIGVEPTTATRLLHEEILREAVAGGLSVPSRK